MQIQYIRNTKIQADSVFQVRTVLLVSWLRFFDAREKDNLTPFQRSAYLVVFKISVCRYPKNLNHRCNSSELNSMADNSILYLHGRNSTICLHGPMSAFNWLFFKILKFSAHLYWAWHHPHSSPFPVWGLLWQWWL